MFRLVTVLSVLAICVFYIECSEKKLRRNELYNIFDAICKCRGVIGAKSTIMYGNEIFHLTYGVASKVKDKFQKMNEKHLFNIGEIRMPYFSHFILNITKTVNARIKKNKIKKLDTYFKKIVNKASSFDIEKPIIKQFEEKLTFVLQDRIRTDMLNIVDLLAHRSVIPDHSRVFSFGYRISPNHLVHDFRDVRVADKFRTKFLYSTFNEIFLSNVIQDHFDIPFDDLMKINLYLYDDALLTLRGVNKAGKVKIGLKNINKHMSELVFSHNGKHFYSLTSEYDNLMKACPVGCILFSSYGMANFLKLHANNAYENESNMKFNSLYEPSVVIRERSYSDKKLNHYVYAYSRGFYIGIYKGMETYSHNGSHGNQRCHVVFTGEDTRYGVFTCINGQLKPDRSVTPYAINMELMRYLIESETKSYVKHAHICNHAVFKGKVDSSQWVPGSESVYYQYVLANKTQRHLSYYAGSFQNSAFGRLEVQLLPNNDHAMSVSYKGVTGRLVRTDMANKFIFRPSSATQDTLNNGQHNSSTFVYYGKISSEISVNRIAFNFLDPIHPVVFMRVRRSVLISSARGRYTMSQVVHLLLIMITLVNLL